ncbi:MAG: DNA alkylation repair protein [Gammaproteobacteria bacterium]|nr:DNA alkylation repair protein [Gammaproteobacteria bacterium]
MGSRLVLSGTRTRSSGRSGHLVSVRVRVRFRFRRSRHGILRIERPRQLPRPPTIGWPGQHRHPFASDPSVTPRETATDLRRRLEAVAEPATKVWFENYLKHAVSYRGVKTPQVSRILADWRRVHDLGQWPDKDQLALARSLIEGRFAEDKFAGTLYIQKYLLRRMDPVQILDAAENLFASGAFFDWSTTDWLSVRVLGPMIARYDMPVARRVAEWRGAENLWQRRSSIVPFRTVVRDEAYHPVIEATVEALVPERDRFIQTGIGWVISDLSKVHPKVAEALVERHFADFSPEVIRRHTRHLPGHAEYKRRASVNLRKGNP